MGSVHASRSPIKMISRTDIIRHFSMKEAIAAAADSFTALTDGSAEVPHRYVTDIHNGALTFLFKPASVQGAEKCSVKMLLQKNGYAVPGLPTITGIVVLIDNASGEVVSIMDGETVTAIRTGAAAGLAAQHLSREESEVLAIFGCGSQGRTQAEAVCAVRDIKKIWLFDTARHNAEQFIQDMQPRISASMEIAQDNGVLKETDIICTATNAVKPLFKKDVLKPGTHINAIGSFKPHMNELHPDVVRSARVYLDDADACLNESGDLMGVFESDRQKETIVKGGIGALLLHRIEGRASAADITLFKSVGNAIQDFTAAREIYRKSLKQGFGQDITLFD